MGIKKASGGSKIKAPGKVSGPAAKSTSRVKGDHRLHVRSKGKFILPASSFQGSPHLAFPRTAGKADAPSGKLAPREDPEAAAGSEVAAIIAHALSALGSESEVQRWLGTMVPELGHLRPIDRLPTAQGRREVDAVLGRIEHGIPA